MAEKIAAWADKLLAMEWTPAWMKAVLDSKRTIYAILFCAYFHAVLRVPFVDALTFFRLLLPLAVLIIGRHARDVLKVLFFAVSGMVVLGAVQSVLCQTVYFPSIALSAGNVVTFWIHYASLLVLGGLLITLWRKEGDDFYAKFARFHTVIIKCAMVCNAAWLLPGGEYRDFLLFGNINNFGCAMVVGTALILCSPSKVYWKGFWTGLAMVLLYVNDSKIALLGMLLVLAVYLIVVVEKPLAKKICAAKRQGRVLTYWRAGAAALLTAALLVLLTSPLSINGYSIREMTADAAKQVLSGQYYPHSNTSLLFRVNAVIGLGDVLKSSCFLGVGAGNAGVILRAVLPGMDEMFANHAFVSSHIWWLETFADFGVVFIVPALAVFLAQVVCFFTCRYRSCFSLLQTMLLLSFPVWCMSASGLYTDFYTLSVMMVAVMGTVRTLWSRWQSRKSKHALAATEEKKHG